ncbi:MAG: matrixin family metalloprotease [Candidatus Liptonbacteria bacterium]
MKNKNVLIYLAVLVVVLALSLSPALARNLNNSEEQEVPEKEGVYDVKGHPGVKLRVFIHQAKPSPIPATSLACNIPDPDSSAVVGGAGWKISTSVPWVYRLNIFSVPSSVGSANLPTIANNAYGAWRQAATTKVSFSNGGNTSVNRAKRDSQNIIAWGAAPSSALAVSYIWYNNSNGLALEVDTIMNKKYPWAWSNPGTWTEKTPVGTTCAYQNVYDAQDILTHELGHTMGLDDEYTGEFAYNTMYGYGSTGQTNADTLTRGDVTGVQNLYQ